MSTNEPVRIVGLTGGIASGKSTVSQMLADHGVTIVDADEIARDVVEPGRPALQDIREAFGDDVIDEDGTLNREALGSLIFDDPEARERLNAITHPRIAREMRRRADAAGQRGEPWVVYDAALIVENGLEDAFDCLVVVTADATTQIERLQSRDDISRSEAQSRLDAQMPLEAKVEVADYLVDNNGALASTRAQARRLFEFLDACIDSYGTADPEALDDVGLNLDPPVTARDLPANPTP